MNRGIIRKQQILDFITQHTDKFGYPPTVREICQHTQMSSTSSAHHYIDMLKREGKLSSRSNKSRSLCVENSRPEFASVPIVGNISAGPGILAEENLEDYIALPRNIYNETDLFILRVEGDSMINAGISNGDYVVVKRQPTAEIHDIVVALWDNTSATVKRLIGISPITLHPENDNMNDIIIDNDTEAIILGKVIGCLKKF